MDAEGIVRHVRADHDALRRILVTVEALARRADDPAAERPLRRHGLELHARLCRHLDHEERELLPALEDEGDWGYALATRIRREHDEQRLVLQYLRDRFSDRARPVSLLARDIECFAAELRDDMQLEDRDILWPLARRGADARSDPARADGFPRTMGHADALLWRMEAEPLLRSTTAAVTVLAHAPEPARLRRTLEDATRAIPRLRQRVVDWPLALATPLWLDDPAFDLDYHLRWVRAPGDRSLRAVLDLAASLAMQAFDRDRPLWEFYVVEDLEGGRAASIQKLHHAVMDGMAGVGLMGRVYAVAGAKRPRPERTPPAPGAARLAVEVAGERIASARRGLRTAAGALGTLVREPRRALAEVRALRAALDPTLRAESTLLTARSPRSRFEAFEVPVSELKAAASACGGRLNDAFLAALAGGWRRYHLAHGHEPARLRVAVPISHRGGAPVAPLAGNHFDLARIEIDVAERDVEARVRAIRDRVARERERSGGWLEAFAAVASRVPAPLMRPLVARVSRGNDFVASCVPGPPQGLELAGAPVESFHAFGPTAGTAANVTLFSLGERAFVTLNVDPAAIPDPARLAACMQEGFEEVLKHAATK